MRRSKDFFPMEGRRGGFGAVGLSVRHWGFGEGVITACGEGTVTVAFGEKRCIFSYPWSFGEELAFLEEEKQKWILSVLEGRDAAHYLKAKWGKDGLHYDLIEDTPVYRRIIAEVKEEIVKRVGKGGLYGVLPPRLGRQKRGASRKIRHHLAFSRLHESRRDV